MTIDIKRLQTQVRIGCTEEERAFPQMIDFYLTLHIGDETSLSSDRLDDTVDYMQVIKAAANVATAKDFALVEHLVATVGKAVLDVSTKIDSVTVTASKRVSPVTECVCISADLTRDS